MAAVTVLTPFPHFKELDGTPLNNGFVYIGAAGVDPEANPVTVYWDQALGVTAAQPIRTVNGYYSNSGEPADVFVNSDNFSITVRDSAGTLIFTKLNYTLSLPFASFNYQPDVTGSVSRDVTQKLSELVSVKDFGAVGDGVTSDNAAFVLAEALSQNYIYLPAGTYILTGLTLTKEYWGPGQIELDSTLLDRFFDESARSFKVDSDFFSDSGAADAYVLTKVNGRPITEYEDGMPARFIADNACTGGAVTVNIDGVAASTIVLPGGSNPASGDISTTLENAIVYDLANTRWVLQDADSVLLANIFPAYSNADPGYIQFKNGLIVQWGISGNVANQGTSDITLPVTFSSQFYAAYSTPYITSTNGQNQSSSVFRLTNSSVRVLNTGNGATYPIQWLAIGV